MEPRTLIELRQVLKVYETPAGGFTALKNVDLTVNAGEFVAVIGKSGSGKSTLINMITGIDRPTLGEVIIGNVPIHTLNEDQMAAWRGRSLGVIFQFFQLLPTLTVLENVMLPMELRQTYPPHERKERALQLLEIVDLADQAHKFPAAISGGQQQRVAIARALANDPDVLVGDEPTGSLDSKTADSIFQLFETLVSQGKTVLVVTHDRELAGRIPRVVFINDGEIADQYVAEALPLMTQQELAQVSSQLEPVQYGPGEVIVRQGDPADFFYIIIRGEANVYIDHPSGKEVKVGRLETGQYFGEMGLMEGGTRTATVRVPDDGELVAMQLDREHFTNLVSNSDLTRDQLLHLMRKRAMEIQVGEALPNLRTIEFRNLLLAAKAVTFSPGEVVFRQDDPADAFYIVVQGTAEVLMHQPGGQDAEVRKLEAGEFFGEAGLMEGGTRSATIRAGGDAELVTMRLSREDFTEMISSSAMTRDQIMEMMRTRAQMQGLSKKQSNPDS
ncbi:MAG: cyclic nucleotide-binding domain-containing protein [Anaerolineae bacterium]|nr:cyclic nucleotide-binding domain-containing protein [Anaerolineae bacterium]